MKDNLLTFEDLENLKLAEDLAKTCFEMYSVTSTGLSPEIAYFHTQVSCILLLLCLVSYLAANYCISFHIIIYLFIFLISGFLQSRNIMKAALMVGTRARNI